MSMRAFLDSTIMAESAMPAQPSASIEYTPAGETFLEKAKRKTLEEPLVPMGTFVGTPHL
jgi:hypothetical protein